MKRSRETRKILMALYKAMKARFGHRNWWPGDTRFEMCVGAILTQNTAWKNVAKAIANLKAADALDPFRIHNMSREELAELIRPAGYYNVKAARLKHLVGHLVERHAGDLDSLFALSLDDLRENLLGINGVGKETADSIVLYAAHKPIFVVDAYTLRVLTRHSLVEKQADYDTAQDLFHANLPRDTALYNDFHAQFVAVGHNYCKKKPICTECPLGPFLVTRPGL